MATHHVIAAAMAAFVCVSAQADSISDYVHLEVGVGGSAYQRGRDGRWVQDGFPHKVDLTAPAFEVGLTGDLYQAAKWGISWHVDYVWLGTVKTQSLATPNDANYNLKTKSCNGPCWPLANYVGSGHNQGFALTLEPHYDVGGWRFGVEGGPYVYRSTWSEDVSGWVASPDSSPTSFHINNNPQWAIGAVVGASVSRKNLTLSYRYFINKARPSDPTPPVWDATHVVMLKYRF
jgi:hypothetical protein